jgi:hypothetical protein
LRYLVIVNDDEKRSNGDEDSFDEVKYEIGELLRSGYFDVEKVEELDEGISQDSDAVQA